MQWGVYGMQLSPHIKNVSAKKYMSNTEHKKLSTFSLIFPELP